MTDTPRRLGKYEIVGILGRGGMGTVYRGYDPSIERIVALKTIRRDCLEAGVEDAIGRFRNEARAAGRLSHPAIVSVYEYGEDQDVTFIAMEFIEGFGLKDYLSKIGVMPLQDSVSVVMQMLDGLAYAHEQGVVHRDIKPSNLIITSKGKVKITDFGVARLEASELTQVGTVIGTPSYMSPEQFMGLAADARSDIFSSGVMLYELLTGKRPFSGSMEALAYRICHEAPVPASQVQPSVPKAFDGLIERALAKRPDSRFPSASAFRDALRLALEREFNVPDLPQVSEETVIRTFGHLDQHRPDPGPATSVSHAQSSTASQASLIENKTLTLVERQLASFIGPVAGVLVRKVANKVGTLNELYEVLAERLPEGADRRAFLAHRQTTTGTMTGSGGTTATGRSASSELDGRTAVAHRVELPEALIDDTARALARYVGPIAKVMARRAAKQALSADDLFERLAAELGDETERRAFRDAVRKLAH